MQGAGGEDRGRPSASPTCRLAGGRRHHPRLRDRPAAGRPVDLRRARGRRVQAAPRLPIEPGAKVVMVEDIVTTGLSSRDAWRPSRRPAAMILAAACIVDRSGGRADVGVPLVALATLDVPSYAADELPPELAAIPVRTRAAGSKRLKRGHDPAAPWRQHRPRGHDAERPWRGLSRSRARRRDWRWPPAPTASPPTCARTAATSPTPTSTRWPIICRRRGRPLNFEMAVTPEMEAIALAHRPHAACLVPERREEVTTEGGLDVVERSQHASPPSCQRLREAGIRVSCFIDADPAQVAASAEIGAQVIELHTGAYCDAGPRDADRGRRPCWQRLTRRRRARPRDLGPGGPRRPRHRLRDGQAGRRHPRGDGAEHRPLPDRRGDLHRPRPRPSSACAP